MVQRAACDLRITAGGDDVQAHEWTGRVQGLHLRVETRGARDRLAHVLAAFARQRVGIVLEPLQTLGRVSFWRRTSASNSDTIRLSSSSAPTSRCRYCWANS